VFLSIALGAVTPVGATDWKKPLIPVTKDFVLANGLRVLIAEDHSVPVAALAIVFDVGARNEEKGRSGFAHLFEHMMFEGSENVGKTEHFKFVESAGGSVNASTHPDFTNYWEKLPSNQIELALWLESDRMRSLKVTEENFLNQLETVKEEKRSRIDNQPYSPSHITFQETLFDNWKNGHPTIGSFTDLEASSVADVRQFFKTYYAPNNAVMAIVGDVDANQMQHLVEKYFSSIPRQPQAEKPDVSEPVQTKPKYVKVTDAHAQLPGFWIGFKAPARRDPDYFALGVLEKILSAGESSRLFQRMVKGDQVALRADMWYDERRGPGTFAGFFMYKPGNTPEKVREILWSELNKLKTEPPSDVELEKAKNLILRGLFAAGSHQSLQRSLGRAELLAEYTSFYGDPKYIDEDLEAYMKVTAADVQRAAQKVFMPEEVTVVDVDPSLKKVEAAQTEAAGASTK
jgi:predicted Zn-dependent peptidase